MGEWSWLAAAGPARVGGVPGPAGLSRPVYGAAQGPSALPSAIPLTFASRSGSSSGALVSRLLTRVLGVGTVCVVGFVPAPRHLSGKPKSQSSSILSVSCG